MNTLNSNEVQTAERKLSYFTKQYEGFDYREYADGSCELVVSGASPVTFSDFDHLKMLCDKANEVIEKVVLLDVRLHLTGCMRCRKFAQNKPGRGPCKRGVKLFEATRINSVRVVHALLSAIENADTLGEEEAQTESSG